MQLHTEATRETTKRFESLEKDLHRLHNGKYTYMESLVKNSRDKFLVTCPVHGNFSTTLNNHASEKNPRGCRLCGIEYTASLATRTFNSFLVEATTKHGKAYIYSSEYSSRNTKVNIHCIKCNSTFSQTPTTHLAGQGCPACAYSGFRNDKEAILYYLKLNNGLYKIGISNRSVEKRYSIADRNKFEVISITTYSKGIDAYIAEQEILQKYKKYKYNGPDILKLGNTELFNIDVLQLNEVTN